jgi:hypothetical protein
MIDYGSPAWKYKRMLEERRGHNYQYVNDDVYIKLEKQGYEYHTFKKENRADSKETLSELYAQEIVNQYRYEGCYSRIVCFPNDIRGLKTFCVIYRKK